MRAQTLSWVKFVTSAIKYLQIWSQATTFVFVLYSMSEVQLIGCFFKPTEQRVLGDSLHGVDTQMLTKDSHLFCMGFSILIIFSVDDHTDFFDNLCSMTY